MGIPALNNRTGWDDNITNLCKLYTHAFDSVRAQNTRAQAKICKLNMPTRVDKEVLYLATQKIKKKINKINKKNKKKIIENSKHICQLTSGFKSR